MDAESKRASDAARQRYREGAGRVPEQGLDLVELFPQTADIEVEIGFGRGGFLLGRAAAAPEAGLVGIELKTKWAYLVAERAARLGLARARAFAGDIRQVLPALGPDRCVARVFVSFPDPWWKKRHAKRRVLDDALLREVARLLRPGGELFVQTDVLARFEEYETALRASDAFDVRVVAENPYGARSNREDRAIADGNPVYRLIATRRG
jgi:tRNA (guanine-N7-)-methyltransferase